MASLWIKTAWGKFRNAERSFSPRLSREQLLGARAVQDLMLQAGESGAEERIQGLLSQLTEAGRQGAGTFVGWVRDHRAQLISTARAEGLIDSPVTEDCVQAELL